MLAVKSSMNGNYFKEFKHYKLKGQRQRQRSHKRISLDGVGVSVSPETYNSADLCSNFFRKYVAQQIFV